MNSSNEGLNDDSFANTNILLPRRGTVRTLSCGYDKVLREPMFQHLGAAIPANEAELNELD